jgi:2-polyprenyl-6-methoxyphenol hydroxylase-like FAD-dependent oxidoreductase
VQINRLLRWHRAGLLCIGDAAHAMSPAGGVGINLAIQDAVAAARLLSGPLKGGTPSESVLAAVQARRELPTRITQSVQVFLHKGFARIFENKWRCLSRAFIVELGYAVGIGLRPEHVQSTASRISPKKIAIKYRPFSPARFTNFGNRCKQRSEKPPPYVGRLC